MRAVGGSGDRRGVQARHRMSISPQLGAAAPARSTSRNASLRRRASCSRSPSSATRSWPSSATRRPAIRAANRRISRLRSGGCSAPTSAMANLVSHELHDGAGPAAGARRARRGGRPARGRAGLSGRGLRAARRLRGRAARGGALPAGPARLCGARSASTPSSPPATFPARAFEAQTPHVRAHDAKGIIDSAVEAVGRADGALGGLQDSMLPVEVGDPALRAGLEQVRVLLGEVPERARRLERTLGR